MPSIFMMTLCATKWSSEMRQRAPPCHPLPSSCGCPHSAVPFSPNLHCPLPFPAICPTSPPLFPHCMSNYLFIMRAAANANNWACRPSIPSRPFPAARHPKLQVSHWHWPVKSASIGPGWMRAENGPFSSLPFSHLMLFLHGSHGCAKEGLFCV
jgi:hypothetical protein